MRLYLSADSKKNIGYTPDWLRVCYEQDDKTFTLTFDLQGEIDFTHNTLDCRYKGDIIPWVLYDDEEGDEIDLSQLDEEEIAELLPDKTLAEIIYESEEYEVGVFPAGYTDEIIEASEDDILSNCTGLLQIYVDENHYYEKRFEFDTELNIY